MKAKSNPPRFLILTTVAIFVFAVAAAVLFFRSDELSFARTPKAIVEASNAS